MDSSRVNTRDWNQANGGPCRGDVSARPTRGAAGTEGRCGRRARERGVRFGRKPRLTRHQALEALARRDAGERLRDIALTFNVSHSTISRLRGYDEVRP